MFLEEVDAASSTDQWFRSSKEFNGPLVGFKHRLPNEENGNQIVHLSIENCLFPMDSRLAAAVPNKLFPRSTRPRFDIVNRLDVV